MRNSASYGGLHHAELCIMRNSASCGTPHAIFRNGLEAFAEKCPNTPQVCGTPHWISASCGVLGQIFRYMPMMRNSAVLEYLRNSARCGKVTKKFSASNIFHFLNLFHYIFCMMRKCCPNTPQEISASKLAENDGFCGNLRYGLLQKHLVGTTPKPPP